MKKRSGKMQDINGIADGPLKQERDRQLQCQAPFAGYTNPWADPVLQRWMYGLDARKGVKEAWDIYLKGKWPGTRGFWKLS